MSMQIDLNDPDSWSDEDKEYLRQRVDTVPVQHRGHLLLPAAQFAPTAEAETSEIARLRTFLEANYPDEMGRQGDTPVGVAIRLLTDDESIDPDAPDTDDYDEWTVAELRKEIADRRAAGRNLEDGAKMNKNDAKAALRADDATQ